VKEEDFVASIINRLNPFWIILLVLLTCGAVQQWRYEISPDKGARKAMQTYYIGRFSLAIPALMEQKLRSSRLRYAEVEETVWTKGANPQQARALEWERLVSEVKKIEPPEGTATAIIKTHDFSNIGKWAKGIFYYNDQGAQWSLLMDAGDLGVWLKTDDIVVEKELQDPRTVPNFENIARAYQPLDLKNVKAQQPGDLFYLQHGVINLPYCEEEESIARFEGHPLKLSLFIEMYMDVTKSVETTSLIDGTRAMLAAALFIPGGSMSKIRLRKREVAGMPGEEAVLKVTEGNSKDLVFTWQYNGKDDSGEYPTTRIEMESHDHFNLGEKLAIWDAVLDSMKPMFERKK
jgi:hypothetical protein